MLGTGMAPLGRNSLAPWAEGLIVTGIFVISDALRLPFFVMKFNCDLDFELGGLIDMFQAAVIVQSVQVCHPALESRCLISTCT